MSNLTCGCRNECIGISVLASIVIGIITAFLTFSATITVGNAFLWVALGIAVLFLALAFLVSGFIRYSGIRSCICRSLSLLITGIAGSILTALILLAIEFAATSIIGAIITGLLLLSFSLIITSVICIIRCATDCPFGSEN